MGQTRSIAILFLLTAFGTNSLSLRLPSKSNEILTVSYIEVGWVNFANLGCYTVKPNGRPLFDIGIIFAANINYNVTTKKAYFAFNENVATVLAGVDKYVRPLQAQGTKVLLSILGNHQGAGISNFETIEAAREFAQEVNEVVRLYGLDGIDFDDEWSQYGVNDTPMPNPNSFLWLLREMRELMPDKILSFYFYGPASTYLDNGVLNAGDYLDYSWNAMYGTYQVPDVPKLTRDQLSPAAVWVDETSQTTATRLARRTVDDGYGAYLFYDLPNADSNDYLTDISEILYGSGSSLVPDCLMSWPPQGTLAVRGSRERLRKVQRNRDNKHN